MTPQSSFNEPLLQIYRKETNVCPGGAEAHLRRDAYSYHPPLCMCVCVCVRSAVLVAVTVWNQKGSRNKFRKRGVYHIPAEHESWEDIRENILNYNEEGGGEQDQVNRTKHTHTQ